MDQVRYSHQELGFASETLFTFDGVVLEIFGLSQTSSGAHQRFHRDLMTINIGEPDGKGARKVAIYAGTRGLGQCMFKIAEQDRHVIDFLERVRAALPAA
jgi:hypothetical protein